jgi:iron transport multicopper oxidase
VETLHQQQQNSKARKHVNLARTHILRSTDPSLNKCTFSCPGDTTQACGGDGTFLSAYYDRLRYVPGGDSIPGLSSPSSGISTSSSTTTTSTTSVTPTPNSPVIVQSIGQFAFVGCYTEATTGRALSDSTYANDNMTVESCYTFCSAFAWFGVEYRRECMQLSQSLIQKSSSYIL